VARSLDAVVTAVATQLMAVDSTDAASVTQRVLQELVAHFDVDASFLRYNDHQKRTTKLVAEWPTRADVPDPDPLGEISFENADPVFAMLEHAKEPITLRPDPITDEYGERIERARGVPVISLAAAPLLSGGITTGALGFIKFDDREWSSAELNAVVAIASLFAQVQARIVAEDRLRYLAHHDELTGLCNRRSLLSHLDERLAADRPGPVPVLFLDLDRLKALNDYLGHPSGDLYINVVAERLHDVVADSGFIARLGGDEFVVVPDATTTADDAEALAERLREGMARSVTIGGETIRRSASIGLALGVPGVDGTSDLLQRADEAVREAKSAGGNQIAMFTTEMSVRSALRNDIELHLGGGIENDGLTLQYLPEVDLRTGEVLAVEALVRWHHPTRGYLSPESFISVAESINLAGELGRWVVRNACSDFAAWRSRGVGSGTQLRVNVSPVQIVSANFAETIASVLDEFELEPSSLCLEITESVVFQDIETTNENLLAVRDLGVTLAIDDFGTGYSVLSHVKSLPVDTVKIDRSFVRDLGVNDEDLAIVRAIVGLAEAFGLEVVAEGVETEAAARTLLDHGCFRAQGFLLSKPLGRDATEELLARGRISAVFAPSPPSKNPLSPRRKSRTIGTHAVRRHYRNPSS
jgi:diguanylate cyclase (GGDEF)-like protein